MSYVSYLLLGKSILFQNARENMPEENSTSLGKTEKPHKERMFGRSKRNYRICCSFEMVRDERTEVNDGGQTEGVG